MELTYLHTFREVAARQSITRAAEALGYAQSSVTAQIQKLETAYDVQLLERFGKGLRLTTAGEELLGFAVQMLELHQHSKEKLAKQVGGTITIGAIDSLAAYHLPAAIQRIREELPELSIRLQTDREPSILSKVREGEMDLGLLLDVKPNDPSLEWLTVRREPLVIVARPGHPLASVEQAMEMQHLEGAEWMMTEESCNYRIMLEKLLRSNGISFQVGLELGNPEAIKRCVMAGTGIAILPRMAAEVEIRRGELAVLPLRQPALSLDLLLVHHSKKWLSHAMRRFIAILQSTSTVI